MDLWAIVYVLLIGVVLPAAAWRSLRHLGAGARYPERRALYRITLVQQFVMAALALWVAHTNDIPLFPTPTFRGRDGFLALALVAALGAMLPMRWRTMSALDRTRFLPLLPRTHKEKRLFVPLAIVAGIGEEMVYRGTLFLLLRRMTGNGWIAAILCATSFAGAHAVQGMASALVIGLIGLALQGLAVVSGALYAGMTVHVIIDLGVGLFAWRVLGEAAAGVEPLDRGPGDG